MTTSAQSSNASPAQRLAGSDLEDAEFDVLGYLRGIKLARDLEQRIESQQRELSWLETSTHKLGSLALRLQQSYAALSRDFEGGAGSVHAFATEYASVMHGADDLIDAADDRNRAGAADAWQQLCSDDTTILTQVIRKVRTDHAFVADRLLALGPERLTRLARGAAQSRSSSDRQRTSNHDAVSPRHGLFELLFDRFFATNAAPSFDHRCRLDLAATILAKHATRKGSQPFCIALLNHFASRPDEPTADGLELCLTEVLRAGSVGLVKSEQRAANATSQASNAFLFQAPLRDTSEDDIVSRCTRNVLALVDSDETGIPADALYIANQAIALAAETDRGPLQKFIAQDWLIDHWLGSVLVHPERLGLLLDRHVSELQRTRILQAVAKKISAAARPEATFRARRNALEEEIEQRVGNIVARFDGTLPHLPVPRSSASTYLLASCDDISALVDVLYDTDAIGVELQRESSSSSSHSTTSLLIRPKTAARSTPDECSERTILAQETNFVLRAERIDIDHALASAALVSTSRKTDAVQKLIVVADELRMPDNTDGRSFRAQSTTFTDALDRLEQIFSEDELVCLELDSALGGASSAHRLNRQSSWYSHDSSSVSSSHAADLLYRLLRRGAQICLKKRDYTNAEFLFRIQHDVSAESLNRLTTSGMVDAQAGGIAGMKIRLEKLDRAISMSVRARAACQTSIDERLVMLNKLRYKMWYAAELKRTKHWAQAWEVIKCLHAMKTANEVDDGDAGKSSAFAGVSGMHRSNSRDRRYGRFAREPRLASQSGTQASSTGLRSIDLALLDLMCADAQSRVGRHKLSDEQCSQVLSWLTANDIQSVCLGEEVLLRFCLEIDDFCRRALTTGNQQRIGRMRTELDDITTSSTWRSELFKYEAELHGIESRQQEEQYSLGALLRRGSASDLFSLNKPASPRPRGSSVSSIDNPRGHGRTRVPSNASLLSDTWHEKQTSWPEARHQSRRPSSSSTLPENDTDRMSALRDFLASTMTTVQSLAMSDFGAYLFCDGSETDVWLSDDLVDAATAHRTSLAQRMKDAINLNNALALEKLVLNVPSARQSSGRAARPGHRHTRSIGATQFFAGLAGRDDMKAAPAIPTVNLNTPFDGPPVERSNSQGSYFDSAVAGSTGLGDVSPAKSFASIKPSRPTADATFPWRRAYRELLSQFSLAPSIEAKLQALYDLETLVVSRLQAKAHDNPHAESASPLMTSAAASLTSLARATMTPAQEAYAPLMTPQMSKSSTEQDLVDVKSVQSAKRPAGDDMPGTDAIVNELQRLLRQRDLRPATFYRDLQLIACFAPRDTLDMTDRGKVFYDFVLAALGVKKELAKDLTAWAGELLKNRRVNMSMSMGVSLSLSTDVTRLGAASGYSTPTMPGSGTATPTSTAGTPGAFGGPGIDTDEDASRALSFAAREGDPTAMRELALLLLERPDRVRPVFLPLSRATEIVSLHGHSRGGGDHGTNRDSSSSAHTDEVAATWQHRFAIRNPYAQVAGTSGHGGVVNPSMPPPSASASSTLSGLGMGGVPMTHSYSSGSNSSSHGGGGSVGGGGGGANPSLSAEKLASAVHLLQRAASAGDGAAARYLAIRSA